MILQRPTPALRQSASVLALCLALAACESDQTEASAESEDSVMILSAFFGLDNGVPGWYAGCDLDGQQDGLPIVLNQQMSTSATLDPAAFIVHRESGVESAVECATLAPAIEEEERSTILLMGEFASADDPPYSVEIVGTFPTDSGADPRGASTAHVVPLAEGPAIVLAQLFFASELPTGGDDECPDTIDHVLQATWNGGVSGYLGADLDDAQRLGTLITYSNGEVRVATQLADTADSDNHVEYCMSSPGEPISITVQPGLYEDPNNDPNVLHSQAVVRPQQLVDPE